MMRSFKITLLLLIACMMPVDAQRINTPMEFGNNDPGGCDTWATTSDSDEYAISTYDIYIRNYRWLLGGRTTSRWRVLTKGGGAVTPGNTACLEYPVPFISYFYPRNGQDSSAYYLHFLEKIVTAQTPGVNGRLTDVLATRFEARVSTGVYTRIVTTGLAVLKYSDASGDFKNNGNLMVKIDLTSNVLKIVTVHHLTNQYPPNDLGFLAIVNYYYYIPDNANPLVTASNLYVSKLYEVF